MIKASFNKTFLVKGKSEILKYFYYIRVEGAARSWKGDKKKRGREEGKRNTRREEIKRRKKGKWGAIPSPPCPQKIAPVKFAFFIISHSAKFPLDPYQESYNINPQPHYFLNYRLLDYDQTKDIIQNIKTVITNRPSKQETLPYIFKLCKLNTHLIRMRRSTGFIVSFDEIVN